MHVYNFLWLTDEMENSMELGACTKNISEEDVTSAFMQATILRMATKS